VYVTRAHVLCAFVFFDWAEKKPLLKQEDEGCHDDPPFKKFKVDAATAECAVCWDVMVSPIFSCLWGHSICGPCSNKVNKVMHFSVVVDACTCIYTLAVMYSIRRSGNAFSVIDNIHMNISLCAVPHVPSEPSGQSPQPHGGEYAAGFAAPVRYGEVPRANQIRRLWGPPSEL
jgi:hypothetical protein